MEKLYDKVARVVLVIVLVQLSLYPIAAVTGWQYSMDWGFTLWREP